MMERRSLIRKSPSLFLRPCCVVVFLFCFFVGAAFSFFFLSSLFLDPEHRLVKKKHAKTMGTSLSSLLFSRHSSFIEKGDLFSQSMCTSRADRSSRTNFHPPRRPLRANPIRQFFFPYYPLGSKFSAEMSGVLVGFAREKCGMYRSKGVHARFFRAFTSSHGCARVRVRALRAVNASSSLSAVFVFFSSLVGNLSLSLSRKTFCSKILTFLFFFPRINR